MVEGRKRFFRIALLVCLVFLFLWRHAPPLRAQLSTADHLTETGFWPTQSGLSRVDFTGPAVCATCHAGKAESQRTTPMANTVTHADNSEVLHSHTRMSFAIGRYRYEIKTDARGSTYSVTDGNRTSKATLLWAFGTGKVGQSYLFKKGDGRFYEARVTYFDTLQNLNFTPARALPSPKDVEEAMYRPVDTAEIRRCFGCHTTAATIGDTFDEKNLMLGITCEACHGAGANHVAAAEAARVAGMPDAARGTIFNGAGLNPVDAVDFCGACHGTFWDVKLSGAKGVTTVKSQPYRLEGSKCWGKGAAQLTCVACHNPHEPVRRDASAYDRVCLGCHTASGAKPTAAQTRGSCSIGSKNCISCHMPKVYVPDMHYKFTDHRIRIAHEGDAYPE
jgi:Cytochrome c554 and c-prime